MAKRTGWQRGHTSWLAGTILIFALGVLFGFVWQNLLLGLVLAAAVSIGWLIAYESWRGRNVGVGDRYDDDGARL